MNETEFAELAAGHALGALSEVDEKRYRSALTAHPEWHGIAEYDQETAALLAEGIPAVTPAPSVRDALLARIPETPQERGTAQAPARPAAATTPASDAGRAGSGRGSRRLLFALAACLVLVVGLGVGASVVVPQLLRPAAVVALDRIESAPDAAQKTVTLPSGGTATAHWSASAGKAVLVADGLRRLDAEKTYELWFVRGDTPVSAGVFSAGQGTTTAELRGSMHAGDAIAVTVEQVGGSPTGAPTSDPIVVIPTA